MRSFMACHIPTFLTGNHGYKIGFDEISPLASSISKRSEYEIMKSPASFISYLIARSRGALGSISKKKNYGLNRSQIGLISKSDLNVNEA